MRTALLFVLVIAAMAFAACNSTRLEAGSNGKAKAHANTSVLLVQYEGGLYARLVDVASNTVLEEVKLDGAGERAWRRKGLLSLRWEPMDPAEARRLLGLPAAESPAPSPSPTLYESAGPGARTAGDAAWVGVWDSDGCREWIRWTPIDAAEAKRMLWIAQTMPPTPADAATS